MKIYITIVVLGVLPSILMAQRYPQSTPIIGWDSLEHLMVYPEICRRGGIEGAAFVIGVVDSIGRIDTLEIHANMKSFEKSVHDAIIQTKWQFSRTQKSYIHFNVHFFLSGENHLNVEAKSAKISVDY